MCGIVGYTGVNQAAPILLDGLSKLEYRGYDSAGLAVESGSGIEMVKAKGRLHVLEEITDHGNALKGACGIGHTRWATHGEPSVPNAHPHSNTDKTIAVVHNGIIENYQELKEKLLRRGYTFVSGTDTEVVAHLLDYYYDGDPLSTIAKIMVRIRGSYAMGILFGEHPGVLYAVRKDSPMIVGSSEDGNHIASDVPAILKYTRDVYFVDNMEIVELTKDQVHFYNLDLEEIEKEITRVNWDAEAAEKGGYEHFMLKEIHEQPDALIKTIKPRIKNGMPDFSECGLTDEKLRSYHDIYIVGCGSAMHAGVVGKYITESLARTPVIVDMASEFRYRKPLLTENDLVLVISQSGETADTLEALKLSNKAGADTLAIVNVVGSSIAREAKMVMYTFAGPEISVCSTKAYVVQTAFMYLFALRIAYARNAITQSETKQLVAELLEIPDKVQMCIDNYKQYENVALKLINSESLLYIGRGLDYALSMEGSLKLKEISYIHSESYAAGELKHGTISLIHNGMPVIAVATQHDLLEKTLSNVKEVKSRGAKVILICSEGMQDIKDEVDHIVCLPKARDMFMPLTAVVPLQLIAYYTAVHRKCDVDRPRNLAKSVTVE